MKNSEKCDHNATKMRPSFISGDPLTMEQLRQMDKKPVSLVFDFELEPMTALVECVEDADCVILTNNLGGRSKFYSYEELRESGIKAYAYPPAHIDLEAWMAEWVDNDESEEMMCKCSKCGYPVSYFWGKTGFCPGCGKAMTPEAQAMLEKRLRGCNQ